MYYGPWLRTAVWRRPAAAAPAAQDQPASPRPSSSRRGGQPGAVILAAHPDRPMHGGTGRVANPGPGERRRPMAPSALVAAPPIPRQRSCLPMRDPSASIVAAALFGAPRFRTVHRLRLAATQAATVARDLARGVLSPPAGAAHRSGCLAARPSARRTGRADRRADHRYRPGQAAGTRPPGAFRRTGAMSIPAIGRMTRTPSATVATPPSR